MNFRAIPILLAACVFVATDAHTESAGDPPSSGLVTEAVINPIPSSQGSVAAGKRIYDQQCVTCHAEDGRGEPSMIGLLEADPPDLTDATWDHGSTDAALFAIIRNGTETGMESFAQKLNERQTWNVINYLRALASARPEHESAADAAELHNPVEYSQDSVSLGKQRYIRQCVECHGMDGRGNTEMVEFLLERTANLRKEKWKYGTKDAGVFRIVRDGTPNDMPAFKEKVSEEQMWHVVNYLRSIRGKN
ncbi:MAG: c-type cytochrome [Candidatus Hydrogenedentes bacterium]|nr:c-type cytochrome [Candidatus Hydrogenedentota bacterium]